MKVLWFTTSSSMYDNKITNHYFGEGWISSLEQLFENVPDIELAVSFLHPADNKKTMRGTITYYPLLIKKGSYLKRIYNNWSSKLESGNIIDYSLDVINDFKPDIIQIFGTENQFGELQNKTTIPIVIHLQGIINSCLNAWYPPGISGFDDFFLGSKLPNIIKANNKWFDKRRAVKQASREQSYFLKAQNVMGRTAWVMNIAKLFMPNANYFEINEVLRPEFYHGKLWSPKNRTTAKILSTISSTTYKGLDQILKTASLLKSITLDKFEWNICGVSSSDPTVKLMERKFKLKYKENNVNFLGPVPPKRLIEFLFDADVYVHPSYIETGCMSIAEAQITGVPVIACYVGGLTSTIENNISGILIPANDSYSMVAKIIYLKENKTIASQIGLNAHKIAMKRHDKEKILSDIIIAYKKILCQ